MLPQPRSAEEISVTGSVSHRPVLLEEVVERMAPKPGRLFVDATLGAGGHAEALLEALGPQGRLIGIDRDPAALLLAGRRLARFGERFAPIHGNHFELQSLLRAAGVFAVDGILLDLGVSSMQLDEPQRGFSFRADGPLDMRMDPGAGVPAAEWLAGVEERELRRILRDYGEERRAAAIARAVVEERTRRPITRTLQLARLVQHVLGPGAARYRIHPATRTFQALRIAVNGEIEGLERCVENAVAMLRRSGRLAVIAYHSLEDRPIKHALRGLAQRCVCPPRLPVCGCGRENLLRLVTTKPVRPRESEVEGNPRARSAKLRVAERL